MRYRNVRTGEVSDPAPGSWLEARLRGLPDVWHPVGEPAPVRAPVHRPAATASKAAWVAYAVSLGALEADAAAATKADLITLYGEA